MKWATECFVVYTTLCPIQQWIGVSYTWDQASSVNLGSSIQHYVCSQPIVDTGHWKSWWVSRNLILFSLVMALGVNSARWVSFWIERESDLHTFYYTSSRQQCSHIGCLTAFWHQWKHERSQLPTWFSCSSSYLSVNSNTVRVHTTVMLTVILLQTDEDKTLPCTLVITSLFSNDLRASFFSWTSTAVYWDRF